MGQHAGGSQGGSQGGYQQYYQKYMGGAGQSSGSTTELLETSGNSHSEKMREKYVEEYVPKEYQQKAIDSIENRTTHHADGKTAASNKATSADSHKNVDDEDQEKKMAELKMRGRLLRGTESGASEFSFVETAELTQSSTASNALG